MSRIVEKKDNEKVSFSNYRTWGIGEARHRFGELIKDALIAPQIIEDRKSGTDRTVAIVSLSDLRELEEFRLKNGRTEHEKRLDLLARGLKKFDAALKSHGIDPDSDLIFPRGNGRPLPDFKDD